MGRFCILLALQRGSEAQLRICELEGNWPVQGKILQEDGLCRTVSVTFLAAEREVLRKAAVGRIGSRVAMPGFRRGKVPESMLWRNFADKIAEEEMAELGQVALRTAETAVGQAIYRVLAIRPQDSLVVLVELELLPKIELPNWDGLVLPTEGDGPATGDGLVLARRQAVAEFLLGHCSFPLPMSGRNEEIAAAMAQLMEEIRGLPMEKLAAQQEQLIAMAEKMAERRLRLALMADAVARMESIAIGREEGEQAILRFMADAGQGVPTKILETKLCRNSALLRRILRDALTAKVLDWIGKQVSDGRGETFPPCTVENALPPLPGASMAGCGTAED
ncbi:MAG: hypothetical protein LBP65_04330 [Puniceicoccales bacterium]|nr:hypothetical protein [Puniceicoccales bacterium]